MCIGSSSIKLTDKKIFIMALDIIPNMKKKLLLSDTKKQTMAKDIAVFEDPQKLKTVLNKLIWKILQLLSEKEMYPMEVAKKLKVHEQKVYYHIRKLTKAGAIKVVREEEKQGAVAKYYKALFPAMGVELPFGYQKINGFPVTKINEKMQHFLSPIIKESVFWAVASRTTTKGRWRRARGDMPPVCKPVSFSASLSVVTFTFFSPRAFARDFGLTCFELGTTARIGLPGLARARTIVL